MGFRCLSLKNAFAALLLLLLASYHPPLLASVAEVIFADGETYAVDVDNRQRQLKNKSVISQGDTIIIKKGYLQLRFSDGGLISFHDNTEFKIEEYQYSENQPSAGKAFFHFMKGMYRTVLGKIKKKRYQVKTNLASIGTRGTEYRAILNEKQLQIDVFEGIVLINNQMGAFEVPAGESALITDSVTPPAFLEMDNRAYRDIYLAPDDSTQENEHFEHEPEDDSEPASFSAEHDNDIKAERGEMEFEMSEGEASRDMEEMDEEMEGEENSLNEEEAHTESDEYEREEEEKEEKEEEEEERKPNINPSTITIENILNGKIPLKDLIP